MNMLGRNLVALAALGMSLVFMSSAAVAQYTQTTLVSNHLQTANPPDPLLVNAWGLARATGSPFWVADNGSGWSTLYNGKGVKQGLQVVVPAAVKDTLGSPTGTVFNGSQQFKIEGWPALFIFATLDGTISGWAPQVNLHSAIIRVNNSESKAVYTALAITNKASGENFLFATDAANNRVDVFNGSFTRVGSFTDPTLPPNFSAFGIRDLNGLLYVAFAEVSGGPGGFIDIFSERGVFLKRLAQGAPLNQPWGFAAAPSRFGPLSNTLLVSNNTDSGTINAFNAITGAFVGTVNDLNGNPIQIDQLWAIDFGGGTDNNGAVNELFFTAGPDNNANGSFGSITLK
jgi:uncharacterized protein (TIGR03118 family)